MGVTESTDHSSRLAGRAAAQAILSAVLRRRRTLDLAADEILGRAGLAARDAGLARAIASETLRRFGQLDALIRHFVPKPPAPHRAGPTPEILLAGACELMFLDVAAHAAVDCANALCRRDKNAVHFKPLVNATLRRIAREGKSIIATQDAQRLNTPDWLWDRWQETYGEATARAMAQAHLHPAPLDIALKGDERPDGGNALWGNIVRMTDGGPVERIAGFAEGQWWVQDAASSLPARLFGNVRGARVIDLCAAPGGKTAQLAASGGHVTAVDISSDRLARTGENLARLNLDAGMVCADMLDWRPDRPAPFVLLDAPCSATGTIRRHPDLPWIKQPADVTLCAARAQPMLDAAAAMLAPGGILVFAVCSLEPEEGCEQAEAFLARRPDFVRQPIAAEEIFGHAEFIRNGDLRTLPCHLAKEGGMDGFYAARLRRL